MKHRNLTRYLADELHANHINLIQHTPKHPDSEHSSKKKRKYQISGFIAQQ
jgi:hypothetical protein